MKEPGPISSAPGTPTDKDHGLHLLSGIEEAKEELALRGTVILEPKADTPMEESPAPES